MEEDADEKRIMADIRCMKKRKNKKKENRELEATVAKKVKLDENETVVEGETKIGAVPSELDDGLENMDKMDRIEVPQNQPDTPKTPQKCLISPINPNIRKRPQGVVPSELDDGLKNVERISGPLKDKTGTPDTPHNTPTPKTPDCCAPKNKHSSDLNTPQRAVPSELDLWIGDNLETSGDILESENWNECAENKEGGSEKLGAGGPKLWAIFEQQKAEIKTQTVNKTQTVDIEKVKKELVKKDLIEMSQYEILIGVTQTESKKDKLTEMKSVTQTDDSMKLTQTADNDIKVTQTAEIKHKVTQMSQDLTHNLGDNLAHDLVHGQTQYKVTQTEKMKRSNKGHPPQSRNALRGVVGREVAGLKEVRASPAIS